MRGWQQLIMIGVALLIAGCGSTGGTQGSTPNGATSTVKEIPTYNFSEPTSAAVTTADATQVVKNDPMPEAVVLDPQAVERGKSRYEALDCGSCHGANGEGTDKGHTLVTYTANEVDFVTFMRSGGSLGASHQYSTNRLSESGATNLYQYLRSLQGQ